MSDDDAYKKLGDDLYKRIKAFKDTKDAEELERKTIAREVLQRAIDITRRSR